MKNNLSKTLGVIVVIITLFFCANVRAALYQQENIPLEGELDDCDMRSIDKGKTAEAFLNGTNIDIEFYKRISEVVINVKNSDNVIVYTKTVAFPHYETISLEGLESGGYTLELTAGSGCMYGSFMYIY